MLNIKGFDLQRALEMDPAFLNTDEEHTHDQSVSSLCIVLPGELDLDETQKWISNLLWEKGAAIFRMKGVLSIAHSEEKFVYQAVHMIFKGNFDVEWEENEERLSKLVFIGKNLNHDELWPKRELSTSSKACASKLATLSSASSPAGGAKAWWRR